MSTTKITPMQVLKYKADHVKNFILHKTGLKDISEIAEKKQVTYLCNYLDHYVKAKSSVIKSMMQSKEEDNPLTIVLEDEYVDSNYLDDYSEYYAHCFGVHAKMCGRMHFFSDDFTERDFLSSMSTTDPASVVAFHTKLQDNYLGFVVIRPIPRTFLARICLAPYQHLIDAKNTKILRRPQEATLFGFKLKVDTAAFVEQDKVTASCSTSALWTLLSASSHRHQDELPSLSEITKSATYGSYEGDRTFPSNGLSPAQITRSLRHFGLEPSIFNLPENETYAHEQIKEVLYAYLYNDTPVLIGGDVYVADGEATDGECLHRYLGQHLVCAVGWRAEVPQPTLFPLGQKPGETKLDIANLRAHQITKFYVHDDRYGPYLGINIGTKPTQFLAFNEDANKAPKQIFGYPVTDKDDSANTCYFTPHFTIIGVNHKVRIPFDEIYKICNALWLVLVPKAASANPGAEFDELQLQIQRGLKKMLESSWAIALTSGVAIKKDLLQEPNFFAYNGDKSKATLLQQNLPKYVWRCRIRIPSNEPGDKTNQELDGVKRYCDLLFDATEVPQGKLFLGYIAYEQDSTIIWDHVKTQVTELIVQLGSAYDKNNPDNEHNKTQVGDRLPALRTVKRFFDVNTNDLYLNTTYGMPRLPMRATKAGEIRLGGDIRENESITIVRDSLKTSHLEKDKKYIWLIDEHGHLVIGIEIKADDMGHLSLTRGGAARLGGELNWQVTDCKWEINTKSGAYSNHLSDAPEDAKSYLRAVIKHKLDPSSEIKIKGE